MGDILKSNILENYYLVRKIEDGSYKCVVLCADDPYADDPYADVGDIRNPNKNNVAKIPKGASITFTQD